MKKENQTDPGQKTVDAILKFGSLINSSLNIEDVLNYAMQGAEEFMNAEASTVYELDEAGRQLFVRIARGEKKEPIKRIKIKLGEGVAGRVVETGQPLVIQDVRKEKIFSNKFDTATGFKTRSMICVPLIVRGKPIGAVQVLNKKSGQDFVRSDLEILTGMSQQIAVALDNAKLYGRLKNEFRMTARELEITQEKLIRSERLEAMGHLVQGVAHEIRNPLMTIGGFASRIKKTVKGNPKLQEYIDIILEESARLETLVKTVNEFAQVLSARLELDDYKPVLERVMKEFGPRAQRQGVLLHAHIDRDLPPTRMDSSQISTAISNIMENALEGMPHGGVLKIEVKHEQNHIVARITDTGCGIDQENLASVYDPFFTSKTRGAGLGLTMVHQILTNHDGEIKIHSEKGVGTTVTLRVPVRL